MQLIDPNHPVYRPLWVRILIVAVYFSWALMAVLAAGAGAYSIYMLLWSYQPPAPAQAEPEALDEPEEQDAKKDGE